MTVGTFNTKGYFMKFKAIISGVGLVAVLTLFQNCGAVRFSPNGIGSSNSKLTAVSTPVDPTMTDGGTSSGGTGGSSDDGSSVSEDEADHGERCKDDDEVVCVLDGPGNSLKLGIIDDSLDGSNNSIANAACISKSACLNKVSSKFKVKGIFPGSHGVCEHNPNIAHLTDEEVSDLLK